MLKNYLGVLVQRLKDLALSLQWLGSLLWCQELSYAVSKARKKKKALSGALLYLLRAGHTSR